MQTNDNDGEFLKATMFAILENASAKLTASAAPVVISQTIALMELHKSEILEIVRRYFAGEIVCGRVGLHYAVDDFVKRLVAAGKLSAPVGINPDGAGNVAALPQILPRKRGRPSGSKNAPQVETQVA